MIFANLIFNKNIIMRKIISYFFNLIYPKYVKYNKDLILSKIVHAKNEEYNVLRGHISRYVDEVKTRNNFYALNRYLISIDLTERDIDRIISTVTDFFVIDNILYYRTYRPGLIIGKGGSIINGYIDYLKKEEDIENVVLIDDSYSSSLCLMNVYKSFLMF